MFTSRPAHQTAYRYTILAVPTFCSAIPHNNFFFFSFPCPSLLIPIGIIFDFQVFTTSITLLGTSEPKIKSEDSILTKLWSLPLSAEPRNYRDILLIKIKNLRWELLDWVRNRLVWLKGLYQWFDRKVFDSRLVKGFYQLDRLFLFHRLRQKPAFSILKWKPSRILRSVS